MRLRLAGRDQAGRRLLAVGGRDARFARPRPAHYPYGFDTTGHLGLICLATAIFVVGALLSLNSSPLVTLRGGDLLFVEAPN